MVSAWLPTFTPLVRLNEPVKASWSTNEPDVIAYVNVGSVAPYSFVTALAVIESGR